MTLLSPAIPTVHLNGTGATSLRDEYAAAYDAIDKAIRTLGDATCNARDFYPQSADAYYQARDERREALGHLLAVRDYTGRILEGICDQL